jgi:hypothetical protein
MRAPEARAGFQTSLDRFDAYLATRWATARDHLNGGGAKPLS